MITDAQLKELGFVDKGTFKSAHIGGPWYIHVLKYDDYLSVQYGNKDPFHGDQVSIWSTFTEVGKLKKLIELLKGD